MPLEPTQKRAERGDLSNDEFELATRVLGEGGLFELLILVGYCATLALQPRVNRVPTPSPDE